MKPESDLLFGGPPLRWLGGKWRDAPWILEHFPPHKTYVEPYGGGASCLLRKERASSEVYNDLDQSVVNFFRVLRDPDQAARLVSLLELTPYARSEYEDASGEDAADPVERARQLVVRSHLGFGSNSSHWGARRSGFRADHSCNTSPQRSWRNYPPRLVGVADRLRDVVIENRPALALMRRYDRASTLYYLDPPYLPEVRSSKKINGETFHAYAYEMTPEQHVEMLEQIMSLGSMVILSGYASDLYDQTLVGWRRVKKDVRGDGRGKRTEILWINPLAVERLRDGPLFSGKASRP